MKKMLVALLAGLFVFMPLLVSAADQQLTRADVQAFVERAHAYAKSHGKEKALQEFMNADGEFFDGELYIFAYDFEGTVISHGAKPALVGKNLMRLKDAQGLNVIEELVKIARGGQGWLRYYWDNPVEQKVMPKVGYVVKVDDSWWLGSGMYESE